WRRRVRRNREEEAVDAAGGVAVSPDDLARVIDAEGLGAAASGIVEGGKGATAVEETVANLSVVNVIPDDLARVINAEGMGAAVTNREANRQRIVEGRILAAA